MTINAEENAYKRVRAFIKQRGYSYLVGDVVIAYYRKLEGLHNSYTMNDCIDNLEEDLKELMDRY